MSVVSEKIAPGFGDKAASISFLEHVEKKESKFLCHPFPLSSIITQHYGQLVPEHGTGNIFRKNMKALLRYIYMSNILGNKNSVYDPITWNTTSYQ